MRVISWNVKGLCTCQERGGFLNWLENSGAFLAGVQEVHTRHRNLPHELAKPRGWHTAFCDSYLAGHSGVGLYARRAPDHIETALKEPDLDREGRLQLAHFGRLVVANVYFPSAWHDSKRVDYKLRFYRTLFARLQEMESQDRRLLVMGDFNTAHREVDKHRSIRSSSPEERAELDRWLAAGFADTFRRFQSGPGYYSMWKQSDGARERNIGSRIDYVLASQAALCFVQDAFISQQVRGSDHAPVGVDLDPSICE